MKIITEDATLTISMPKKGHVQLKVSKAAFDIPDNCYRLEQGDTITINLPPVIREGSELIEELISKIP